MSVLVAAPELLISAATDLKSIGSALGAANAAAAGPTTGLATAAADEISTAVAALFTEQGQQYHRGRLPWCVQHRLPSLLARSDLHLEQPQRRGNHGLRLLTQRPEYPSGAAGIGCAMRASSVRLGRDSDDYSAPWTHSKAS